MVRSTQIPYITYLYFLKTLNLNFWSNRWEPPRFVLCKFSHTLSFNTPNVSVCRSLRFQSWTCYVAWCLQGQMMIGNKNRFDQASWQINSLSFCGFQPWKTRHVLLPILYVRDWKGERGGPEGLRVGSWDWRRPGTHPFLIAWDLMIGKYAEL